MSINDIKNKELEKAVDRAISKMIKEVEAERTKLIKNFVKKIMPEVERDLYEAYYIVTKAFYDRANPKQYIRHTPVYSSWHGHKIGNYKNVGYNLYQIIEFHKLQDQILKTASNFDIEFNFNNLQPYKAGGWNKRKVFNAIYINGIDPMRASWHKPWVSSTIRCNGKFVNFSIEANDNIQHKFYEAFSVNNPYFEEAILNEYKTYINTQRQAKGSNGFLYPWLNARVYANF